MKEAQMIIEMGDGLTQYHPVAYPDTAPIPAAGSHCPHCKKHMHTMAVLPQVREISPGHYVAGEQDMLYVCGLCENAHFVKDGMRQPIPPDQWQHN